MAPPVAGSETHALLFGDMGTHVPYETFSWTQRESVNTMKWLHRDLRELGDRPTFVSHIGDISYARGYSWLWDNYFAQIEPVAARAPWLVCIGNHEYDWPGQPWNPRWAPYGTDSGGECGVPYSLRFRMPGSSSLPVRTLKTLNPLPLKNSCFLESLSMMLSNDVQMICHFTKRGVNMLGK